MEMNMSSARYEYVSMCDIANEHKALITSILTASEWSVCEGLHTNNGMASQLEGFFVACLQCSFGLIAVFIIIAFMFYGRTSKSSEKVGFQLINVPFSHMTKMYTRNFQTWMRLLCDGAALNSIHRPTRVIQSLINIIDIIAWNIIWIVIWPTEILNCSLTLCFYAISWMPKFFYIPSILLFIFIRNE